MIRAVFEESGKLSKSVANSLKNKVLKLQRQVIKGRVLEYIGKFSFYSCAAYLSWTVLAIPELLFVKNRPLGSISIHFECIRPM